MNEMEVPEGWEKKFLKDVFCQKNLKWVPNQSEKKLNYVGLENIESNSGRLVMFKPTESNQIKSSKTVFSKDDILYGKLRPYLNKVLIPDFDGVCSTDILVLQPKKGMNKKFIWYFLKSSNVLNPISKITFGSKMPRTKIQDLEKISILVPSETLQKKIVKKLDILFVQLNNKKKEINDLNQNVVY